MEAPLGLVCLLDRSDVGLGQRIVTIRGTEGILDNRYLKYYLQSSRGQNELMSRARGTTVIGISQKNLMEINIVIPPYWEQQMISKSLSAFEKKIINNNAIISNLEAQAQAIFKSWFVDFEPFQDGEFVDGELGLIPEGWEVKFLNDLATRRNGYTYKSIELRDEACINMLTLKSFNRYGGLNFDSVKPIVQTDKIKEFHFLNKGDILIACTDLTQSADVLGRVIYYIKNRNFEKEIYSMDLVKIEPNRVTDNLFLYAYLESQLFKNYAESVATGTTVLHLPKKSIDEFRIIFPPKRVIDRFSRIIKPILDYKINIIYQNEKLAQIRDTLLPKLISGETRVGNDELEELETQGRW